eukprot:m.233800 g.233800  ORF g.233800 m.233800 type:complete len:200 (+) comp19305_c0_seq1:24-623(+)
MAHSLVEHMRAIITALGEPDVRELCATVLGTSNIRPTLMEDCVACILQRSVVAPEDFLKRRKVSKEALCRYASNFVQPPMFLVPSMTKESIVDRILAHWTALGMCAKSDPTTPPPAAPAPAPWQQHDAPTMRWPGPRRVAGPADRLRRCCAEWDQRTRSDPGPACSRRRDGPPSSGCTSSRCGTSMSDSTGSGRLRRAR